MALKIIAVDDEVTALNVLKTMVEPLGCEVLAVVDSRDAARLIEHEKFDGAVVDVQMPHVDGLELTRLIRNSRVNRHIPITPLFPFTNLRFARRSEIGTADRWSTPRLTERR